MFMLNKISESESESESEMCLADFMATVYDEKLNKNSNADPNLK